jgi:hypothetical protein
MSSRRDFWNASIPRDKGRQRGEGTCTVARKTAVCNDLSKYKVECSRHSTLFLRNEASCSWLLKMTRDAWGFAWHCRLVLAKGPYSFLKGFKRFKYFRCRPPAFQLTSRFAEIKERLSLIQNWKLVGRSIPSTVHYVSLSHNNIDSTMGSFWSISITEKKAKKQNLFICTSTVTRSVRQ